MDKLLSFYPQLSLLREALGQGPTRVFLVGGALRDYCLGRPPGCDLDFAVDKGAIVLARRLARKLKGTFVLLDAQHGTARIVKKQDGKIWTFDLTDWRGKSIQQDLLLRDFTVNALALDVSQKVTVTLGTGTFPDILHVDHSRQDLKAGRVRMVTLKVFKDDPLRLLRAFSLQATLGFKIEAATLRQIKKDGHLIAPVAVERIREEIFKILSSPRAAETLEAMDKAGLLPKVMPQVTVMYGVHQGGFHHLDVWKHTLEVVRQLEKLAAAMQSPSRIKEYLQEVIGGGHSRLALLKMAALLHDIGKPETRRREKGRTSFHGHEHAGEHITRLVAKQLKLSIKERYFLEDMVRMHLRPGYLSNFKRPSDKAVFRFLRDARDEAVSLAILGMADQAATRGPLTTQAKHRHHTKICRMLIDRYFEIKERKPTERLLTGKDLIRTLKLKPSEIFGKVLASVDEAAALGKIRTKQEALAIAKNVISNTK